MESIELAKKLEGLQTIQTVMTILNISRTTAIKYIHLLRKAGFVKTTGGGKQARFFHIQPMPLLERNELFAFINKYSKIKLKSSPINIAGKKLSVEEALVRAVLTNDFRIVLASLYLFNHIKNWVKLSEFAEKNAVGRRVLALYRLAKLFIKVKKIDPRTEKKLECGQDSGKFIVEGLKSRDFCDLEKKYDVFLPFNKNDFRRQDL